MLLSWSYFVNCVWYTNNFIILYHTSYSLKSVKILTLKRYRYNLKVSDNFKLPHIDYLKIFFSNKFAPHISINKSEKKEIIFFA